MPTITNDYVYQNYIPEKVPVIDNKRLTKVLENHANDSPISSEYDDSLDVTHSLTNTPSLKSDNIFNQQFEVSSRRSSLEFDPIGTGSNYHAALLDDEDFEKMLQNSPPGITESDVNRYYDTHEQHLVDDYTDLHLYEEDLLFECSTNRTNKGYVSDAESVKTYQDSGIYDDDVFIDSPKHMTNEEYAQVTQQLVFSEEYEEEDKQNTQLERFSAFKTPNSSRQNSLELLLTPDSPLEPEKPPPQMSTKQGQY